MNTTFQTGLAYAKDELHQYREDFFIQPGEIYMDGNFQVWLLKLPLQVLKR